MSALFVTDAGRVDWGSLWGFLGLLVAAITPVVGFVAWAIRNQGRLTWKRAAALQAAALEANSQVNHSDPVVVAAAQLQRTTVMHRLVAKQTPLGLPWVVVLLGLSVLIFGALSDQGTLIFTGILYSVVGLGIVLFTASERRRLILIHTPASPLNMPTQRAAQERLRRRVRRQIDHLQVQRSFILDITEGRRGQRLKLLRIWRRAARAYKTRK